MSNTINLTELEAEYQSLIDIVEKEFSGERLEKLLNMYTDFEDIIIRAPASSRLNFHNAYPGGYVDHVKRVYTATQYMTRLYEKIGGFIDFTQEEAAMVSLHHDFGKLGFPTKPKYLEQTDQWRKNKLLEVYTHDESAQFMTAVDQTLFILQQYGIELTHVEYLGIKLHDGLYEKGNEEYLMGFKGGPMAMKTNLPSIVHWADHAACKAEKDKLRDQFI